MKPSKNYIRLTNMKVAAAGRFILFLLAWFCLCLAPGVQAASITWGTATTIFADTDVSTSGTLVYACDVPEATVSRVASDRLDVNQNLQIHRRLFPF
jgi:hypothetical protein